MALFFRLNGDNWGFSTKADSDWESNLIRLGYLSTNITVEELANAFKR